MGLDWKQRRGISRLGRVGLGIAPALLASLVGGCSSAGNVSEVSGNAAGPMNGPGIDDGTGMGSEGDLMFTGDLGAAGSGPAAEEDTCAAERSSAELSEVHLIVLLDKSGSMGDGRNGIREEKWDPVTVALTAFFDSPDTMGLQASLTMFPEPGSGGRNNNTACNATDYSDPVVPMTALPSGTFAQFISGEIPDGQGTPTRPALEGAIAQAQALTTADPNARAVVVLVTDGEPTQCNDNDVDSVAQAAAAVAQDIPTYVIGVGDSLTALNQIASSGATDSAFLVSLVDPAQTQEEFNQAISEIRGQVLSCDTALPTPPAGQQLDPQKINVQYTSGAGVVQPLAQSADCADGLGWRYDDPLNPGRIQLCPATCEAIQADPGAALELLFGCVTVLK